ncbi:hypothetical protein FG386_000711 [Cryptosporidium ryanae]|uniref:uncharacterized protein n=1 Tax=Cryptosporidium ryanae TaxID=515981 RepID=UPI00351A768F|nr:hypothetical protein FG386_000711 [Cryptosporidium ryanae]
MNRESYIMSKLVERTLKEMKIVSNNSMGVEQKLEDKVAAAIGLVLEDFIDSSLKVGALHSVYNNSNCDLNSRIEFTCKHVCKYVHVYECMSMPGGGEKKSGSGGMSNKIRHCENLENCPMILINCGENNDLVEKLIFFTSVEVKKMQLGALNTRSLCYRFLCESHILI